jgi:hypothetical protein
MQPGGSGLPHHHRCGEAGPSPDWGRRPERGVGVGTPGDVGEGKGEERGGRGVGADGEEQRLFFTTPSFMALRKRSRKTAGGFLFCPSFVIPFVIPFVFPLLFPWCALLSLGQAWAEGKGDHLQSDRGRGEQWTGTGQCVYRHDLDRSHAINE